MNDVESKSHLPVTDLDLEEGSGGAPELGLGSEAGMYGYDPFGNQRDYRGFRGMIRRVTDLLVHYGVEERGIVPRPEDEREDLSTWSYLPQFTLWAAFNTNILTFSEGMIGPTLFGLDLKASVLCIIFFTALSCLPPAYLACNGPRTGMRQMVQARFALGYVPAMIIGLVNSISQMGFLSLVVILGGQSLSLASAGSMSWSVGIVVVAIISLLLSFVGLGALHILSLASFPIILVLFIALAGVTGSKLQFATNDIAKAATAVTASGVLGYGASLIGFTISYGSLASDFTTSLPPHTSRVKLFLCVFVGLFVPIVLIQIFGAACQLAAFSIPAWNDAAAIGTPNLLFAMTGSGHAARFVMVMFCFSVCANTAPTIYSAGLSGQVAIPWLVRVPRYFLAFVVSAIYLPVAIVGSTHFYTALSNFLSVLAYWTAIYIPPVLIEPLVFRRPVSRKTYPLEVWDRPGKLPIGIATVAAAACGIPVVAAGMSQTWWTGWIARRIGGAGDVGWELGFAVVAIIFILTRYLERRFTGR
ncbi:putative cytosine-purine permease [Naematelia encephala]|uniref:Putative cytosine-purine permease n=1 Tax=Naematelia encephala TaxID=71784 RepID=A0A1Y2BG79_9TREE|nr:putative cytosine-purine permease [Naematelia encephala]